VANRYRYSVRKPNHLSLGEPAWEPFGLDHGGPRRTSPNQPERHSLVSREGLAAPTRKRSAVSVSTTQLNQCRDTAKFDFPMTRLTCRCRVGLGSATTDQGRRSSRLRTSPAAARSPGPVGVGEGDAEGASPSSSMNRSISSGPPSRSSSAHARSSRMASRLGRGPSCPSRPGPAAPGCRLRSASTPPAAHVSPSPG
jgi:hypothetical protein